MKRGDIVRCDHTHRMGRVIGSPIEWPENHIKIQWYGGEFCLYPRQWVINHSRSTYEAR